MSLNWDRLVGQGRAKDIGIAWTNEELVLLYDIAQKAGISREVAAGYVRNGATSYEDYLKAETPKTRGDVEKEAKLAGVNFSPEAPTAVLEKETAKKVGKKKTVKKGKTK
jgi:hypothetical protein